MKKRIIFIIIIYLIIFIFLNRLLMPKYKEKLIEGSLTSDYYESIKDHELIFLGDCEVYANFSPMVLYEKYGIKSYIRGNSQQLIWQSYYILEETIQYEKPKVVVLNVNSLRYDKNSDKVNEAYNRLMIDNMKWSITKYNLIKESKTEEEKILSYIFPIFRYHSRFDQLSLEDTKYLFSKKTVSYNGFIINKKIKPVKNLPTKRNLNNYTFNKNNMNWLNKIYELCKINKIELILIKAPSLYPYWYKEYDNQIIDYAISKGIKYYNLLYYKKDIGIDYQKDTYDGGLHLNLSGATKNSIFFGKILIENTNLNNYEGDIMYNNLLSKYNKEVQNEKNN